MKRFAVVLAIGLLAFGVNLLVSRQAAARAEYKTKFTEMTMDSKASEAIAEAKCNVCHYGTNKKNRNDFGKALNKHINKEVYDEIKQEDDENKTKLFKKIEEALKSAFKEKSKNGKTYGELIESGSLPAENPEE
jgi:hypothetical protein